MVKRYIVTSRECRRSGIAAVYKSFQRCLLDEAGVYRVSVTSDTSCEVQVLVTASAFEHQNVHDHCSYSFCDLIEDNLSEQVLNEPSKTDPSEVRPPSSPNKRGNEEEKNPICLILFGLDPTDECRKCLGQYSDFYGLGEFTLGLRDDVRTLYVMTSRDKKDTITKTCGMFRICRFAKNTKYPDHICEQFYNDMRALKSQKSMKPGVLHPGRPNESKTFSICLKITLNPALEQKVMLYPNNYLKMLEHLNTLFDRVPTYVHWLKLGHVPTDYSLLLILTAKDIIEKETNEKAPYFLQKLTTEECLPSYQLRFNLQPYVKLILPGLPGTHDRPTDASKCFLAYSRKVQSCQQCIEPKIEDAVIVSKGAIMGTIQVDRESIVAKCFNTEDACKRLEIIPDAICMQRLKKSSDMGPEYDLPDYSEDEKPRIWSENVVANRKSNSQTRNSNADAMVTFVLAEYKDPKCLLLFSRAHSVFFVSTEPQYIWMLEDDTQSKSPYLQCVKLTEKTFNHDIRSLHPISHDNMLLHLGRKENELDICEEVFDWTPFSGKLSVRKGNR